MTRVCRKAPVSILADVRHFFFDIRLLHLSPDLNDVKHISILALFISLLFMGATPHAEKYRWSIKLLIDTAGQRVYGLQVQASTIKELVRIKRPANAQLGKRRAAAEKLKVKVACTIIATGLEDDGDYHLIIVSGKDTMIAEIPNPKGVTLSGVEEATLSGLKTDYTSARTFINTKTGKPKKKITTLSTPLKVKLTGICFFDKKGHGKGHAKNGIELHPVLGLE